MNILYNIINLTKEDNLMACSIEKYNKQIKRVVITEEEISIAIKEAGKKISDSYDGRPILLVSILKGAFVFMADLCRAITVPCEVAFMCAKSYYSGSPVCSESGAKDLLPLLFCSLPLLRF